MRHKKHRHQLGVKKEHRSALMANLASALFTHGRIQTTLAKAKALRPFCEKIITLAKKAAATDDKAKKLHFRRIAIARVRDKLAIKALFDEKVTEFTQRNGGYIRIYKLVPRVGDAADMAIIELIDGGDEGYKKSKKRSSRKKASTKNKIADDKTADTAVVVDEAPADASTEASTEDAVATVSEEPTEESK